MVFLQQSAIADMGATRIATHLQAFATMFRSSCEGLAFGDDESGNGLSPFRHLQVAALNYFMGGFNLASGRSAKLSRRLLMVEPAFETEAAWGVFYAARVRTQSRISWARESSAPT